MKSSTHKCLYCYKTLQSGEKDFHSKCSKAFFGTASAPALSLTDEDLNALAKEIVKRSVAIPGVQPKLSLSLQKKKNDHKNSRLTIVGLWGEYILKPQSQRFKSLPENEDLIMHLAERAGIKTAEHTLLRTDSGQLTYITKRFDRQKGKKVPMEDFCQLAGLLSVDKYKSTMEKAGAIIGKYASPSTRTLDYLKFFELAVFSFLVGNADMHLKNFSMIKDGENQYSLSPAYDLLSTRLAMPSDKEDIALSLHGKKKRLRKPDFLAFGNQLGLPETLLEKTLARYDKKMLNSFEELTARSFLTLELQEKLFLLMQSRFKVF